MERTKEIRYFEKLGIKTDNIPRNFITINPMHDSGFLIRTPITFTIGETDLKKIMAFINSLGLPGRRLIKALVRSIRELPYLDEVKNNFWVVGYTPEDVIKYAQGILIDTMKYNRVPVIPITELDKNSVKNFIRCFGGIRGVQALFTEILTKTVEEFRRIRKAEDVLNDGKIESEISSDELGSVPLIRRVIKKQCFTCKHCYTDGYGDHICLKKPRPIPGKLTVAEVNELYPSAKVYNCNLLKSRYILHEVHSCEDYNTRVY